MATTLLPSNRRLLPLTLVGIVAGGAARLAWPAARVPSGLALADAVWASTIVLAFVPLAWSVAKALRQGRLGVDLIALAAMGGTLALGEYLAGAVVALMLSGGQALEGFAGERARHELTALLARAPQRAHRYEGGQIASRPLAEVAPGDLLLVKPGEVVPVDGQVAPGSGVAVLDESALSGESRPVERREGEAVASGTVNAGGPFDLRAVATAAASTYAAIVGLVTAAQAAKAPFVRLADRYALVFLPLTLLAAAGSWLVSGDPVRAVAVLVVATPCPLILAAPVALVAGVSACARRGVIVKGGRALEALAGVRVLLLDKTGTLTTGTPRLAAIETFGTLAAPEVLRLAASLDQVSPHVLASAVVRAARERGLALALPEAVAERPGDGIRGRIEGREVVVGKLAWVAGEAGAPAAAQELRRRVARTGAANVFVGVGGAVAGALVLDDPLRPDGAATVRALRRSGIRRVVLVTGDLAEVAAAAGAAAGVDEVLAERSPADKVATVARERAAWGPVLMVGDGVNDAPALAAADAGVAMGARGATASSEAADAVIAVDRLDRVADALRIARRTHRIAVESVVAGMGLSLGAMLVAGAGHLPPLGGALLQEGIDVAVLFNALRALSAGTERDGAAAGTEGPGPAAAGGSQLGAAVASPLPRLMQ